MARYIDVDAITDEIWAEYDGNPEYHITDEDESVGEKAYDDALFLERLHSIPTADVRPVEHAQWVWESAVMEHGINGWVCSKCHTPARISVVWDAGWDPCKYKDHQYCGCCGAKMVREVDNE